MVAAALVACGGVGGVEQAAAPTTCRPQPPQRVGTGVAHVAGAYTIAQGDESFVVAGAHRSLELGSRTLKLFLTPRFREQYPQSWPGSIDSLEALARTSEMTKVFDMPFDTYVLTVVSFSMGVDDPWRERDVPLRLAGEAQELEGLMRFLAARYQGTGKTFVLQNWEGDWALAGGFDRNQVISADRAKRMQNFLNARHETIARVREELHVQGVTFASAVEANLVLDSDTTARVTSAVLPGVCTDLVSYSAWEATDVGGLAREVQVPTLRKRLETAIDRLTQAAPAGAKLYLGEFGFPENEGVDATSLVRETLSTLVSANVSGGVYWQVFDNECHGSDCRGLWLLKPDGSRSAAAQELARHFSQADIYR